MNRNISMCIWRLRCAWCEFKWAIFELFGRDYHPTANGLPTEG